jgi:hypothetical protein
VVGEWDIPAAERDLLLRTGMPRSVPPIFELTLQRETRPVVPSADHGMLYRMGWDQGRHLSIAPRGKGVYAVDPDGMSEDWFVSSSLIHFAEFLQRFDRFQAARPSVTDDDGRYLTALQRAMAELDPPALVDGWWPLVLEQLEYGLL